MSPSNDGDTTNREDINDPIKLNNSTTSLSDQRYSNNPMPFTTGFYNQESITYKHSYTLFVPPITLQYTRSRYANRKNCLFYVNFTLASKNYVLDSDELFHMYID